MISTEITKFNFYPFHCEYNYMKQKKLCVGFGKP